MTDVGDNQEWLEGGPPRPMNAEELAIRNKWVETRQGRLLRVGAQACASVVVRLPSGDESIGTAFHVGEGVYLTARHLLDGNEILSINPYHRGWLFRDDLIVEKRSGALLNAEIPMWRLQHSEPRMALGPFYHSSDEIDVAAFVVEGIDANTPFMELGLHYDDWISDEDWLLTTGVVFGYPPVPTSVGPIQLAATVEVNGIVDTYRDRYVRFVVSGPPRGGFSGGPVYHSRGFVLGMVIESLERLTHPEPGFFTVLSIEALREVLTEHNLTPAAQAEPTPDEIEAMVRQEIEDTAISREASSLTPDGQTS